MLITIQGVTLLCQDPPSGMGATPHMGPPSSRIPPYILSECQIGGDNTLYNTKKFLGKNCLPHPLTVRRMFYPLLFSGEVLWK